MAGGCLPRRPHLSCDMQRLCACRRAPCYRRWTCCCGDHDGLYCVRADQRDALVFRGGENLLDKPVDVAATTVPRPARRSPPGVVVRHRRQGRAGWSATCWPRLAPTPGGATEATPGSADRALRSREAIVVTEANLQIARASRSRSTARAVSGLLKPKVEITDMPRASASASPGAN